jgi:hypothetical protein
LWTSRIFAGDTGDFSVRVPLVSFWDKAVCFPFSLTSAHLFLLSPPTRAFPRSKTKKTHRNSRLHRLGPRGDGHVLVRP